jgi:hypothetical protein
LEQLFFTSEKLYRSLSGSLICHEISLLNFLVCPQSLLLVSQTHRKLNARPEFIARQEREAAKHWTFRQKRFFFWRLLTIFNQTTPEPPRLPGRQANSLRTRDFMSRPRIKRAGNVLSGRTASGGRGQKADSLFCKCWDRGV